MNLWTRFKVWVGLEIHPEVAIACARPRNLLIDSACYNIDCEDCGVSIARNGHFHHYRFHTKNVLYRGDGPIDEDGYQLWRRPEGWRENNMPEYRCQDCAEKRGGYEKISDSVDAPIMGKFHHDLGTITIAPDKVQAKLAAIIVNELYEQGKSVRLRLKGNRVVMDGVPPDCTEGLEEILTS